MEKIDYIFIIYYIMFYIIYYISVRHLEAYAIAVFVDILLITLIESFYMN